MHRIFLSVLFALTPLAVMAESGHDSPVIIVGETPKKPSEPETSPTTNSSSKTTASPTELPPNFPEWAVSVAGDGSIAPKPPPSPTTPPAPESPAGKLWPRDTVPIFVKSCMGLHVELIPACTCVITALMVAMPHNEFLKLSESNKIDNDPRYLKARTDCATAPERRG